MMDVGSFALVKRVGQSREIKPLQRLACHAAIVQAQREYFPVSQSISQSVNQSVSQSSMLEEEESLRGNRVGSGHPGADNSGDLPLRENHPAYIFRWFDPSSEQLLQPFSYAHVSTICIHVCSLREKL